MGNKGQHRWSGHHWYNDFDGIIISNFIGDFDDDDDFCSDFNDCYDDDLAIFSMTLIIINNWRNLTQKKRPRPSLAVPEMVDDSWIETT